MANEHVQFRAPEELVEKVEQLADEKDLAKSEVWRSLAGYALANGGAETLEATEWKAKLDQIKHESYSEKREAWFRSNVGGRLLSCFNSGLSPDEAELDMASYYREASELHEQEDFVEYVDEALSIYADAYQRDRSGMLKDWVKARDADPSAIPDDVADDPVKEGVATDAENVTRRTVEDFAKDAVNAIRGGGLADSIDEYDFSAGLPERIDAGDVRERTRELLDERGETDE